MTAGGSKPSPAGGSKTATKQFVWVKDDEEGQPLSKRRRTGETRKQSSATGWFFILIFLFINQYFIIQASY